MIFDKIISVLNSSKEIAILPHISADGDALGSSLGFALALTGMGKSAKVILEEDIPQVYSFLPGRQMAEVYEFNENITILS